MYIKKYFNCDKNKGEIGRSCSSVIVIYDQEQNQECRGGRGNREREKKKGDGGRQKILNHCVLLIVRRANQRTLPYEVS